MRHSGRQPVVYVDAYQCPSAEAAVPADCLYAEGVAILVDEGGVVTGPVGTTVAGELSVDVTIGATVTVSVVSGTGPEGKVAVADALTIDNVADGTAAVFVFVPMSGSGDGGGDTDGGGDPDGEPGTGPDGDGSGVGNEEPIDLPTDTTAPLDNPSVEPVVAGPDVHDDAVVESSTSVSGPTTPSGLVTVAGLPSTGVGQDRGAASMPTGIMLACLATVLLGARIVARRRMGMNR